MIDRIDGQIIDALNRERLYAFVKVVRGSLSYQHRQYYNRLTKQPTVIRFKSSNLSYRTSTTLRL